MFIEQKLGKTSPQEIVKEAEKMAEVIDYGRINEQAIRLTKDIFEGKEVDPTKYPQVSQELIEILKQEKKVPQPELYYLTLELLTTPSPEEQKIKFQRLEGLLKEKESMGKESFQNSKRYFLLETVLKEAESRGQWDSILFFLQNPENQKGREPLVEKTLKEAEAEGWWDSILSFLQNPENQKGREPLVEKALKEAESRGWLGFILFFLQNPENQKGREPWVERTLKEAEARGWWSFILSFLQNPENQKGREPWVEKTLKEAEAEGRWDSILSFLQNPENQKGREPWVEKALKEAESAGGWWRSLLFFFENPENQKGREPLVEKALKEAEAEGWWDSLLLFFENPENQKGREPLLEKALEEAKSRGWWDSLLLFFENPENQKGREPLLEEIFEEAKSENWLIPIFSFFKNQHILSENFRQSIHQKILNSIESISDKNLHSKTLNAAKEYLSCWENPLSLVLFSSTSDLPIILSAYHLNVDPVIIKSWRLSDKEKETLLPILLDLKDKAFSFDFHLPFIQREEEKPKLKNRILQYFTMVNSISSLPEELKPKELLYEHFQRIKEIQAKEGVQKTTTELKFSFLREILKEIQDLRNKVVEEFKEMTGVREIEREKIEKFLETHQEYIKPILVLFSHYQKIYKDGLPLLGKILTFLIQGNYLKQRYNLEDEITRQQLAPLIEGYSKETQRNNLEKWQEKYPFFQTILKEERKIEKEEEPGLRKKIIEHLKTQVIEHKHFESLFNLEEFKGLEEKERNKILQILHSPFLKEKGEDISQLKKLPLQEEKQKILLGLISLLKDIHNSQKTLTENLKTIEKLEKNINEYWEGLHTVEAIGIDILRYLKEELERIKKPRETIQRKAIYLTYFTDNPLTLLEIGKYPISTCQSYESKGGLNRKLLGYIFDAHIKTQVIREISLDISVSEEELNRSQINLDEDKGKIEIIIPSGQKIAGKISKPVVRRIVMLGSQDNKPILVLEPIYSSVSEVVNYQEMMEKSLSQLQKELPLLIPKTTSEGISLPPSHNPEGYLS